MKPLQIRPWVCFTCILMILTACNVTKNLGPKEYLLIQNKFKINTMKVTSDDLSGYLQQQPNKKLFGLFRSNIALYNWGCKGKDSKFKKWLRNTAGAAPVLLDTSLAVIACKQMTIYLANKGYFNSTVRDSIVIKKKKASVHYHVKTTTPYKIKKLEYAIPDTLVARFIYKDTAKSLIKPGMNFDAYKLDDERTRIAINLNNKGFYRFSTNYIAYRVDSTIGQRKMDVTIEITDPVVPSVDDPAMMVAVPHKRYYINRMYIYPEFDHLAGDSIRYDTLLTEFEGPKKEKSKYSYYFLYDTKMSIKPRTITQSIFVEPGSYYSLDLVNETYSRLAGLQVFKYINLRFAPSESKRDTTKKNADPIDCRVQLSRSPGHAFTVSTDGTNSAGAFGLQGGLTYSNRNIFRGAQLLRIGLSLSAQTQPPLYDSLPKKLFNVLEIGLSASLTFPQFLFPIKPEHLPKKMKPKTTISIGYNFQRQQDYDRHITNMTFGYTWVQNSRLSQTINPVEIALVKVFGDEYFDAYLNSLTDQRLKYQYTDHLVAGLRYTLQYTSQKLNRLDDYIYLRTNFETGGNLLYGIDNLVKAPKNSEGYYTLLNIQYAQYVRPDFDIRYYEKISKQHTIVYRFYTGIGIPYGNSIALPFEKAFFAGGANDLRGWKMGYLGPGSYHNDTTAGNYNQFGDMQIEANMEYRFPIYKVFKGALFLDMGNVWLIKPSTDLPGGVITLSTFLPDIAIDAGIGLRLDFNFFMIRLDPAIPIRVPWYPQGQRWYFNKMQLQDIVWNFGIGYPF
ncbi:MAG: BamA/TamA family outer membrane protein [Bacteroidetes bacterium]|nr:BamA/TamA family outer membrane protein [Bacteroidota bacterium]